MSKPSEKGEFRWYTNTIYYAYAVITAVILSIFFAGARIIIDDDIANWVTLVIEVGIGITITIIVWKSSKGDQKKTKDILDALRNTTEKLDKVAAEQEMFRHRRKEYAINSIFADLSNLNIHVQTLSLLLRKYNSIGINVDPPVGDATLQEMEFHNKQKSDFVSRLESIILHFDDVIDAPIVMEIRRICEMARKDALPGRTHGEPWVTDLNHVAVISAIDAVLVALPVKPI